MLQKQLYSEHKMSVASFTVVFCTYHKMDWLVPSTCTSREIISKAHFPAPAAFHIIIILNKNNLFEFKHVDGPDENSMPDSIQMLSSEDSSIEQY